MAFFAQFHSPEPRGLGDPPWFLMPVAFVIVYPVILVSFLILGKIVSLFARGIGDLAFALMALMGGMALAVGDPLVYWLHKKKPGLVPVESFRFINLTMFLAVLRP